MTVLILTEECDLTADRVVQELEGRGVAVVRADTGWFPTGLWLDAELREGNWHGQLRTASRRVELLGLRSIWYRRPSAFTFPHGLSAPERQHATWEAKFGLGGVLASLPVRWVNHPSREADAAYKPRQLAVAAHCGLPVPDTLITNDPAAVRRFAAAHDRIVVKALGANALTETGGAVVAYTHPLAVEELVDLSGVDVTAHQFQEWIPKDHEIRLTVVGKHLFAAAICAHTETARTDWRADMSALSYRIAQPPPAIARGVRAYMATFGLCYAAFDFVVRPDGRWLFLEANPGGQYGWIEAATGLPITAGLADLLEARTS